MTLQSNEQQIQSQIRTNIQLLKQKLISCNIEQSDINQCNDKLTALCQISDHIVSETPNNPIIPRSTTYGDGSIYRQAVNNYNRIQYCNNLLRYALKRRGVNVGNKNNMRELIQLFNQITLGNHHIVKIIDFHPPTTNTSNITFKIVNKMDIPITNTTFKTENITAGYEDENGDLIQTEIEFGKTYTLNTNSLGIVTLEPDYIPEAFHSSNWHFLIITELYTENNSYYFDDDYFFETVGYTVP